MQTAIFIENFEGTELQRISKVASVSLERKCLYGTDGGWIVDVEVNGVFIVFGNFNKNEKGMAVAFYQKLKRILNEGE